VPSPIRTVAAVLEDLIFTVKIRDAARRAGVELTCTAHEPPPGPFDLLIIDLNIKSLDALDLIRRWKDSTRIAAYVSHVQIDLLRAAQAAGAHTVVPRSAFVRELDGLMRGA